jgi:hypothetical protein
VVIATAAVTMTGALMVGVSSASWRKPSTSAGQIVCPDVKSQLPAVPAQAQAEVDRNLALLQTQIDEANKRLVSSQGDGGPNFVQNAILGPLKDKRVSTIDRIAIAIGRVAQKPNLDTATLGTCVVNGGSAAATTAAATTAAATTAPASTASASTAPAGGATTAPPSGTAAPAATGPVAADFISIRKVKPKNTRVRPGRNGSTGTFNESCGQSDHQNSDNSIAAPGVTNGAHHLHDYVGNKSSNGASTNDSLAASGTTCRSGNKSTFFWTVVRDLTKGKNPQKRVAGELDADLNVGKALLARPTIQFQGNPNSKVTAMPDFLRILAGDAKSPVNGGANQHAQFTCQGFTNRISTTQYTLCPGGRGFTRIHEFPSCWDGQNTDSANHRTHIVYPNPQTQVCPASNPVVVPKLVTTLVYNVPAGPNFAIDSFPESLHSPISDHDDFINLASKQEMTKIVNCINTGKRC